MVNFFVSSRELSIAKDDGLIQTVRWMVDKTNAKFQPHSTHHREVSDLDGLLCPWSPVVGTGFLDKQPFHAFLEGVCLELMEQLYNIASH